jgi:glycosyltransferase involved in cell wall biosynthesis
VVLVDDGSTDGTGELMAGLAAADPWIKLAGRSAAGRSAALSLALRHATGEVLICAGTGSRFDRDTVKRLLQGFTYEHTGAVVPAGQLLRRALARSGGLPAGAGSVVAFPREVLEHAGGFRDADNPAAAQLEAVGRVRRAGYRVGFAPRALAYPAARS